MSYELFVSAVSDELQHNSMIVSKEPSCLLFSAFVDLHCLWFIIHVFIYCAITTVLPTKSDSDVMFVNIGIQGL